MKSCQDCRYWNLVPERNVKACSLATGLVCPMSTEGGLVNFESAPKATYHLLVQLDGQPDVVAHHNSRSLVDGMVRVSQSYAVTARIVVESVQAGTRHIMVYSRLNNGKWDKNYTKGSAA